MSFYLLLWLLPVLVLFLIVWRLLPIRRKQNQITELQRLGRNTMFILPFLLIAVYLIYTLKNSDLFAPKCLTRISPKDFLEMSLQSPHDNIGFLVEKEFTLLNSPNTDSGYHELNFIEEAEESYDQIVSEIILINKYNFEVWYYLDKQVKYKSFFANLEHLGAEKVNTDDEIYEDFVKTMECYKYKEMVIFKYGFNAEDKRWRISIDPYNRILKNP